MSIRDQIIASSDIETELVEVPAWGVTVEVRSMDGRTRLNMMSTVTDTNGEIEMTKLYPDIIIACAHDPETGERVFDENDRDLLLSKSAGALELVASASMRVSGMAAASLDEAGKDSSSTATGDSPSS